MKKLIKYVVAFGAVLLVLMAPTAVNAATHHQVHQVKAVKLDPENLTAKQEAALSWWYIWKHHSLMAMSGENKVVNQLGDAKGKVQVFSVKNAPEYAKGRYGLPQAATKVWYVTLNGKNGVRYTQVDGQYFLDGGDGGFRPEPVTAKQMVDQAQKDNALNDIIAFSNNMKVVEK